MAEKAMVVAITKLLELNMEDIVVSLVCKQQRMEITS